MLHMSQVKASKCRALQVMQPLRRYFLDSLKFLWKVYWRIELEAIRNCDHFKLVALSLLPHLDHLPFNKRRLASDNELQLVSLVY